MVIDFEALYYKTSVISNVQCERLGLLPYTILMS